MRGRDEMPALREEGFSARDAGRTLVRALSAVATTAWIVALVGPLGLLSFPASVWLFWRDMNAEPVEREDVPWMTQPPESQWLDDAYASRQRGTGISTLAVRYDVDPDWLETELARDRAVAIDDRPVVDARRQRAEGVAPVAGQP